MNIITFKAKCSQCKSEFVRPELGDFSYGDAIFTGLTGEAYTYFYAIDHPVTKIVEKALPAKANFFSVCAKLADPVNGQTFVAGRVCPCCHSTEMEYWHGNKGGVVKLKDASYTGFLSLTESEQDKTVIDVAAQY